MNECGFDMIYQDGAEATPGGWHGVAKMGAAIVKRFKRPVRVEASGLWRATTSVMFEVIGLLSKGRSLVANRAISKATCPDGTGLATLL